MPDCNDIPPHCASVNRLPSLDGWRAIFIGLVLSSHFGPLDILTDELPILSGLLHNGQLAVRCFFVLSGFLITSLLMVEATRTTSVDIGGFLCRRALRLLPVYAAFLMIVAAAQFAGNVTFTADKWLSAMTFTANFNIGQADWPIFHLWSLSIEQQFYLVWPFALMVLKPWRGMRVTVLSFVGLLAFVLCFRLAAGVVNFWVKPDVGALKWLFAGGSTFHFADSLAAGCLAACIHFHFQSRLVNMSSGLLATATSAALVLLVLPSTIAFEAKWLRLLLYLAGDTIAAIGCAVLLTLSTLFFERWPFRILDAGPLAFFGAISYSIYIWQQPFTTLWLQGAPAGVRLLAALAVAAVSYFLLERPLMRLRKGLYRQDGLDNRCAPVTSDRASPYLGFATANTKRPPPPR
jgi:peptidoglycan/LPS O-acetylase OafA/YrhL